MLSKFQFIALRGNLSPVFVVRVRETRQALSDQICYQRITSRHFCTFMVNYWLFLTGLSLKFTGLCPFLQQRKTAPRGGPVNVGSKSIVNFTVYLPERQTAYLIFNCRLGSWNFYKFNRFSTYFCTSTAISQRTNENIIAVWTDRCNIWKKYSFPSAGDSWIFVDIPTDSQDQILGQKLEFPKTKMQ